jgi:isopenicillin-N epimerase
LVYVTNATTGLNIVARSLALGPGDEVLASDHEYGALDRTWRFLSRKRGFTYTNQPVRVPITGAAELVESFWRAITPATRVIFLSHITSPTAVIFPVEEICRRARAAGILTVIDGAHAPGQIPLDLDALGADVYSGNLHKWLCAPKGAAFLYARPEVQHLVEPLVVSWGWESETPGPSRFIDEQEWTGTRDLSPFLTVPAAIQYQHEHDWPRVRAACHGLLQSALQRIRQRGALPLLYPDTPEWYSQMGTAQLPPQTDIIALKARLYDEYRVEVPLIEWNGHKLVRVSIQAYNTLADVDRLLEALSACGV